MNDRITIRLKPGQREILESMARSENRSIGNLIQIKIFSKAPMVLVISKAIEALESELGK